MSEMIERVAKALAKESGVSDWAHVSEHGEYDSRDYWRRLARSAIVTMRAPTEDMVVAYREAQSYWSPGDYPSNREVIELGWPAMIDEALKLA